ncbi:YrrS family protein [Alkalihalobacillus sp. MEB130]|uniref:YrrS family protein n=1 Tax=Alkalihalobacillus sp. MEB130 TaxID=2976704 RepID=UPI0028DE9A10|nr:YrrS family protein [Alkalihalobacillus sp. MEB130]MDT8861502.1 YrrS family protein [Alkalihalobacillus sp. MEB130]
MQGYRFEQRKKKRENRILNVAIAVVTILIIVVAVQIFLGATKSEEASTENDLVEEIEETNETEVIQDPVETNEEAREEEEPEVREEEDSEEETEMDEEFVEAVPEEDWSPVGTSQTGEFTPDFTKNGTNWNEMVRAIQQATGFSDMTIFWLGNGGSATRARGEVSDRNNPSERYEVFIEWVDGQGWMPVEKNKIN